MSEPKCIIRKAGLCWKYLWLLIINKLIFFIIESERQLAFYGTFQHTHTYTHTQHRSDLALENETKPQYKRCEVRLLCIIIPVVLKSNKKTLNDYLTKKRQTCIDGYMILELGVVICPKKTKCNSYYLQFAHLLDREHFFPLISAPPALLLVLSTRAQAQLFLCFSQWESVWLSLLGWRDFFSPITNQPFFLYLLLKSHIR